MPSQKTERASERKRLRNLPVRSSLKSLIDKAEELIYKGQKDAAQKVAQTAIKAMDKAAEKGIIHPNNAARRKSRLMAKLNKAPTTPLPETKRGRTRKASPAKKAVKEEVKETKEA